MDDSVTISDIILALNFPSSRKRSKTATSGRFPPSLSLAKNEEAESNGDEERLRTPTNIPPKTSDSINDTQDFETRSLHSPQRLCYSRKQAGGFDYKDNPFSFLSQQQFLAKGFGRSASRDELTSRLSDSNETSDLKASQRCHEAYSWTPLHPSSMSDRFVILENIFNERSKTLSEQEMGIQFSSNETSDKRWNDEWPTAVDRGRGARLSVDRWWFTTKPEDKNSSEVDPGRIREGSEGDPATGRPERHSAAAADDDEAEARRRRRRKRIDFRFIAERLRRTKRIAADVVPATDPAVYSFPDPLSEQCSALDLSALADDGADWSELTGVRASDPTEERIVRRLIQMTRLERDTVALENAAEKATRPYPTWGEKNVAGKTVKASSSNGTECSKATGLMQQSSTVFSVTKSTRRLDATLSGGGIRDKNSIIYSHEPFRRKFLEEPEAQVRQKFRPIVVNRSLTSIAAPSSSSKEDQRRPPGKLKSPLKPQNSLNNLTTEVKNSSSSDREVKRRDRERRERPDSRPNRPSGLQSNTRSTTIFNQKSFSDQSESKSKVKSERKTVSVDRNQVLTKRPCTAA